MNRTGKRAAELRADINQQAARLRELEEKQASDPVSVLGWQIEHRSIKQHIRALEVELTALGQVAP